MKNNKVLPALLALGLTTGATIAPAFAEETNPEDTSKGIVVDKTAELKENGTYTINLSAYATGVLQPMPVEVPQALDIVLVIDQSGSIANKGYLDGLKKSVRSFVESVRVAEGDHKVSIVGYASGRYDSSYYGSYYENTGLFVNGSFKRYDSLSHQDYVNSLVNIKDDAGKLNKSVDDAITKLTSKGATRASLGMGMAQSVLNARESTEGRKSVVVMFTDGEPGKSGYETNEANSTLEISNQLKLSGSDIFTIGLYQSASTNVDRFMNGVSSNYKNVSSMDDFSGTTKYVRVQNPDKSKTYTDSKGSRNYTYNESRKSWGYYNRKGKWETVDTSDLYEEVYSPANAEKVSDKYYKTAEKIDDLNNIFTTITQDILKPTTHASLDANSVLRDIMSEDFDLPENSKVTVYTRKGSKNGKEINWSEKVERNDLNVSKNSETDTVEVSGFNYKELYIADEHPGQQLIVQIDGVEAKDSAVTNNLVNTNAANSGIYQTADSTNFIPFPAPQTILTKKAYVVDYAQKIKISDQLGMNNSKLFDGMSASKAEAAGKYGNYSITNGESFYNPNTMKWDGIDKAYALGETAESFKTKFTANKKSAFPSANDNYIWGKVSVMPANNVYYEDDFSTEDRDSDPYKIFYTGEVAKGQNDPNEYVSDGVHGSWVDNTGTPDSGDSVTDMTYEAGNAGTATFNFVGTGFDVYGRSNAQSGTISVKVKDANGATVSNHIINTVAQNNEFYNIPVLTKTDLAYGEYSVTVKISGAKGTSGKFALDGIRIYNPMGDTNTEEYAGEYHARFATLRHHLGGFTGFVDYDEEGRPSSEYAYETSEAAKLAPNNEIYLANGQSITFNAPQYSDGTTADKYYVSMKAVDGITVPVSYSNVGTTKANPNVASAISMYYEVAPVNGKITIKNEAPKNGELNILSIAKVRVAMDEHNAGINNSGTVTFQPIAEGQSLEAAATLCTLPVAGTINAPVEEEVKDSEPVVDDEKEDDSEFISDENIPVDVEDNSSVESNKKVPFGLSFLKGLFNRR